MTLTKITSKSIKDNEIVNADLHSAAAIASTKLAKPIDLADNEKIRLGTSQDLEVFHDGSNSIINDNGTGELQLQRGGNTILTLDADGITITDPDGRAEVDIKGFEGNGARLRLTADEGDDNGDQWMLESAPSDNRFNLLNDVSGSQVDKWSLTTDGDVIQKGHLDLPDSKEIRLGDSDDLQIYHDGSHSRIKDSGTGHLIIQTSELNLMNAAGNEDMIKATPDAGIEFYYNNVKRFEVAQYGAICTGTLQTDALDMGDSDVIRLGDGDDFQIQHNGSNNTLIGTTGYTLVRAETEFYLDGKTNIRFRTGSTLTDRARIDDEGALIIGGTTANGAGTRLNLYNGASLCWSEKTGTGNHSNFVVVNHRATGNTKGNALVFRNSALSSVGTIRITNTGTEFNTTSDYRLKENVVEISDGITRLKALKPSRFNFIADETNTLVDGFLAHEVSSVIPEAISGEKDAVVTQALIDSEDVTEGKVGDPIYQEIDQSKIVPLITAALKEAVAKIETLETKVAALEAA